LSSGYAHVIEEPVWPPMDFALAEVRAKGGLAIAAEGNAARFINFAK